MFHTTGFGAGGGETHASTTHTGHGGATQTSSSEGGSGGSGGSVPDPVCGDHMIDGNEECDDGNHEEGDRCSPTCTLEHAEVCPGAAIHLALGEMVVIHDSTMNASDKFQDAPGGKGNCFNGSYPGSDLIYAVTPAVAGTLTASLDAQFSKPYVHVRTQCPGDKKAEIACRYSDGPGVNTVIISVSAGVPYFVAADSWQSQAGDFTLTLKLQ